MARFRSQAQRNRLPTADFALPGKGEGPEGKGAGSYPIPDESHARNALARVSQHGSAAEKAEVRRKVHAKFPGIQEAGMTHHKNGMRKRMPYTHSRGG